MNQKMKARLMAAGMVAVLSAVSVRAQTITKPEPSPKMNCFLTYRRLNGRGKVREQIVGERVPVFFSDDILFGEPTRIKLKGFTLTALFGRSCASDSSCTGPRLQLDMAKNGSSTSSWQTPSEESRSLEDLTIGDEDCLATCEFKEAGSEMASVAAF